MYQNFDQFTPPGHLAAPDQVLKLVSCGCKTGQHSALVPLHAQSLANAWARVAAKTQ